MRNKLGISSCLYVCMNICCRIDRAKPAIKCDAIPAFISSWTFEFDRNELFVILFAYSTVHTSEISVNEQHIILEWRRQRDNFDLQVPLESCFWNFKCLNSTAKPVLFSRIKTLPPYFFLRIENLEICKVFRWTLRCPWATSSEKWTSDPHHGFYLHYHTSFWTQRQKIPEEQIRDKIFVNFWWQSLTKVCLFLALVEETSHSIVPFISRLSSRLKSQPPTLYFTFFHGFFFATRKSSQHCVV